MWAGDGREQPDDDGGVLSVRGLTGSGCACPAHVVVGVGPDVIFLLFHFHFGLHRVVLACILQPQ